MCGETVSSDDLLQVQESLIAAVQSVNSIAELSSWLKTQPCVETVQGGDYLLKTNPPQREIRVAFKQHDGSLLWKLISVYEIDTHTLQFNEMHDPE